MQLVAISLGDIWDSLQDPQRLRKYCAHLEAGDGLYFPQTPIQFAEGDLDFLLSQKQVGAGYRKNIAYKPATDQVTGFVTQSPETGERLRSIMRKYSSEVVEFLGKFLSPYESRWQLDYASFRPQEEEGRDLSTRKRNDLLHTDAFPTRPTHGDRIMRFFNNINPVKPREWITTETFDALAKQFAGNRELASKNKISLPESVERRGFAKAVASTARSVGLSHFAPALVRPPYDDFMLRFHHFLKENTAFQRDCPKRRWSFPPGSSWMVYTDMVSHAVLSGQYALEQTFLVSKEAMVTPERAPINVLRELVSNG
jgi:3-deoxy-D-manno-oct-2-ulosonic acid (Kdo) hydroxylase